MEFSAGFVKTLGGVEILGAIDLILPALLNIVPIMLGAGIVEYEYKHVLVNLIYLALTTFVAWGRFS